MKGPLDGPVMAGSGAHLDDLNALVAAPASCGAQVRPNTYLRPYEDGRIIVNMSVWEKIDHLRAYVYATPHAELLKQRRDWFEKPEGVILALWWIPAGHIPSIDEAKQRLASLEQHGPTQFAFTFKTTFPPIVATTSPAEDDSVSERLG
jgi:hypothetical protein